MLFIDTDGGRMRTREGKEYKRTKAQEQGKHAAYRDVGSIYSVKGPPQRAVFAFPDLTVSLILHRQGNGEGVARARLSNADIVTIMMSNSGY
jgi:hypothetical protein